MSDSSPPVLFPFDTPPLDPSAAAPAAPAAPVTPPSASPLPTFAAPVKRPRGRPRRDAPPTPAFVIPPGVPANHVATDGWIYYPPTGAPNLPPHMRAVSPAQAAAIKGPALLRMAFAPPDPEVERLNREYYAANPYKPLPAPPSEPLFPITPEMRKAMDTPIVPREIVLPPEKEEEIQKALDERMAAWERGERPDFKRMDAEDKARMDAEAERYAREEAEEKKGKGTKGGKRRRDEAEQSEGAGAEAGSEPATPATPATPGVTYAVPGLALGHAAPRASVAPGAAAVDLARAFRAWLVHTHGLSDASAQIIVSSATRVWRHGVDATRADLGQEQDRMDERRIYRWWAEMQDDPSPVARQIAYGWGWWLRFGATLPSPPPGRVELTGALQPAKLPLRYLKAVGVLASYCPGWADPMTWQASFWTAELGALLVEKRAALPVFSANPTAFEALVPGEKLLLYFAALQDDLASYAAPLGWIEGQRLMPRVPYSDRCPDVDTMQRIIQLGMMSPAELAAAQAAPVKRRRGRPSKWAVEGGGASGGASGGGAA